MFHKKYKLKNKYFTDIEPHEVFLDSMAKNEELEAGFSAKKIEVPVKEKKAYLLMAVFSVIVILFFIKIFFLQIVNGNKFFILAENNKGKSAIIKPERGIIYDRNMKKMVSNSPDFDLVCDRKNLQNIDKLSEILKIDISELQNNINDSQEQNVLISENLSQEGLLVLEARIKEFPGCKITDNVIRNYLLGSAFSHLLGYTGRVGQDEIDSLKSYALNDSAGKTGLEKYYEDYLRGTPGKVNNNQEITKESVPGDNLVLNIDASLQQEIYNQIQTVLKNIGSKKAAAVAIDPNNGQVLALVSYPSYDNNLFAKGISKRDLNDLFNDSSRPFFDRAISSQYPTGSTIKPFEAIGALQENLISPAKIINDPGYIKVQSKYDPNIVYTFGGVKPHGLVDMREAIAVSSNIYFYTIGGGYGDQQGLGPTRIAKYLSLFGWGQKTGIDLPGEFKGFIPSPEWKKQVKGESWWDGDTYNLSIGQSDLQVTPIQLATAYCAIANGGTLYQPQIVNKIVGEKEFQPEIIRQNFVDEKNLQVAREGMREGVTNPEGSSYFLNSLPVPVAAKTGTAEIGRDGFYNTWTSVFAPYDKPQIVLVVTIENVEGLKSGSLTVARNVLDWYFKR